MKRIPSSFISRKFRLSAMLVARYGDWAYKPYTREWRAYWIAYRIWHDCMTAFGLDPQTGKRS